MSVQHAWSIIRQARLNAGLTPGTIIRWSLFYPLSVPH